MSPLALPAPVQHPILDRLGDVPGRDGVAVGEVSEGPRQLEDPVVRAGRKTKALDRFPAEEAGPGDIIAVAGIEEITIGETLADPDDPRPLPVITID